MAIEVETITNVIVAEFPRDRQVISPNYKTGTFVINDTDDHQFKVDGRGKSKMTVLVDNPGDQILTVKVFGMHDLDGLVDAVGAKQIGSDFTVGTTTEEYRTVAAPFPFYAIQVTSAGAASGSPTCTVFIDFHSGS